MITYVSLDELLDKLRAAHDAKLLRDESDKGDQRG